MSPDSNQQPPRIEAQLDYLWNEYKYRHSLCWKAVYQIVAVVIVLEVLPYAKAEVTNLLGYWMLVPPVIGTLFAAFGIFVVNNELKLFAKAKLAHGNLHDRFLTSILKEPKVRGMALEDIEPSCARWTPFDVYVHIFMVVVVLLSLGNILLLALWIPKLPQMIGKP